MVALMDSPLALRLAAQYAVVPLKDKDRESLGAFKTAPAETAEEKSRISTRKIAIVFFI